MLKARAILIYILACVACAHRCAAQSSAMPQTGPMEKVIIDTDIGDDIDDAFAVALALRSPELQILGITTTFGDTEMRAKLLDRLLRPPSRSFATPKGGASQSHHIRMQSIFYWTRFAATRGKSRVWLSGRS